MPFVTNPDGTEQLVVPNATADQAAGMGGTLGDLLVDRDGRTLRFDDGVTPGGVPLGTAEQVSAAARDKIAAQVAAAQATIGDLGDSFVPLYLPDLAGGFIDGSGYVADAIDGQGRPVAPAPRWTPFDDGAVGSRNVAVMNQAGTSAFLAYADGDNRGLTIDRDRASWITGTGGSFTRRVKDLSLRPPSAASVARLLHIPVHGQSNSLHWLAAALDQVALNPGRALMFGGYGGPHLGVSYPPLSLYEPGPLVDLKGAPFERGGIGMRIANRYLAAFGADQGAVVSGHGVGGQPYANLKRGTVPYTNMLRALIAARLQALAAGLDYLVPFSVWIHGEDEFSTALNTYLGYLNEYQAALQADIAAITGSNFLAPVFMAQPSSWTCYGANATTSQMPLAMVAAMLAAPTKFSVVTPFYPFDHTTEGAGAVHLTQEGNRSLDTIIGHAASKLPAAGGSAANAGGLYPISATRSGTTITVTCRLPIGTTALSIKTNRVTNPGQNGLVYRNTSGAVVALSNIAVSGNRITMTAASAVAGTLGFATEGTSGAKAGPTTGPRCNICAATGDTFPDGTPLDYYMLHSTVAVP